MAYTALDRAHPVITDTRQVVVDKTRTNAIALSDAITLGAVDGWARSVTAGTGTAEEPQYVTYTKSSERLRMEITWSGGYATSIKREWSNDNGSSYSTIATEVISYDGSGNQITGSSAHNSAWSWLFEWIGKIKALRTLYIAHVAATSSVHGIVANSMAAQAYTAVNIDGGTIDGTTIGGAASGIGRFLQAREASAAASLGGSTYTCDWSTAGAFTVASGQSGSGATLSFINYPASGTAASVVVTITNAGIRSGWTWPTNTRWEGGTAPTIGSLPDSGKTLIAFFTDDAGANVYGSVVITSAS